MATFTFKWPHTAEEVYVTGTFDDWKKTEELEKVGAIFEKKVKLPVASEKIYYKFVVDGAWTTDHAAPQETDSQGNVNNVLLPKDMSKIEDADPAAALISSAAPESTTAQLAAAVPLSDKPVEAKPAEKIEKAEEKPVEVAAPGGYPETPLAELDKEVKVNPLPAAEGAVNPIELAPGEKIPDEVKAGSTTDNVTLDKESYEKSDCLPGVDTSLGNEAPVVDVGKIIPEATADDKKEFSVNPLPATEGALNPPDGVTTGSVTDNVTLDKESYEKSDRLPGVETGLDIEAPVVDVGKIIPEPSAEDKKEFSVNPLPATDGALNPPDGVTTGSVTDNVTLDKESYEKSDRLPGLDGVDNDAPVVDVGKIIPEPSVSDDDKRVFSVNPLPATEGALNPPEGVATGSITDNVTLDKESYEQSDRIPGLTDIVNSLPPVSVGHIIPESSLPIVGADDKKEFSINPLPATEGALNPPEGVATGSITDNVTLDKESYEKSDRIPGIETELPPVVGGNIIPESSLPITSAGDAIINTVTPESTTAKLAAEVPLEKKEDVTINTVTPEATTAKLAAEVPLEGKKEDATVSTVAPGSTTAELAGEVPLEKRDDATISTVAPEATTVALAGAVPLVAPDVTINTVTPQSTTAALAAEVPLEPKVPEIVKESQEEAKVDPEASAIPEEVKEKAAVEEELLKVVPEAPATSEGTSGKGTEKTEADKTFSETVTAAALSASAAVVSAGAAAGVAAVALKDSVGAAAKDAVDKLPAYAQGVVSPSTDRSAVEEISPAETPAEPTATPAEPVATPAEPVAEVPAEVKDSIKAAGDSPEAAANPVAVEEKKEVEAELLKEVKEVKPVEVTEASTKAEEPVAAPAVEEPKAEPKAEETPAPVAVETNGTKAVTEETPAAAPASTSTEAAPAKPDTSAAADKEKKKRHRISAFFSKIKHKLQDH
ncbi:hypothetical protein B0T16DRAFT_198037 [Cercophora newfieldiana]|uniref:AMP-activated protein kinase glycogen-binding domain-containing protein n=1 Tax=Cercophora newfieldiana TaxID=92897 RepID=A0AA40CP66_9PEZI|nr:hypothetical protein B0T16DRAFT_198037 [Cercophora newfieldiana]